MGGQEQWLCSPFPVWEQDPGSVAGARICSLGFLHGQGSGSPLPTLPPHSPCRSREKLKGAISELPPSFLAMAAARWDPGAWAPVPKPGIAMDPIGLQFPHAERRDSVCPCSSQHCPDAHAGSTSLGCVVWVRPVPRTSVFTHGSELGSILQVLGLNSCILEVRGVKNPRKMGFRKVKIQKLSKEPLSLVMSRNLVTLSSLGFLQLVHWCVCSGMGAQEVVG